MDARTDLFEARDVRTAYEGCARVLERPKRAGFTPWDVVRDRPEFLKAFGPDRERRTELLWRDRGIKLQEGGRCRMPLC